MTLAKAIGLAIADLRHARGWTLNELARRACTHHPVVARVIRGDVEQSLTTLARYAAAFELKVSELLAAAEAIQASGGEA